MSGHALPLVFFLVFLAFALGWLLGAKSIRTPTWPVTPADRDEILRVMQEVAGRMREEIADRLEAGSRERVEGLFRAKEALSHLCKLCHEVHGPDAICMGLLTGAREFSERVEAAPATPYRHDQWVRVTRGPDAGRLFRYGGFVPGSNRVVLKDDLGGIFGPHLLSAIEPATPKEGERWIWKNCPNHPRAYAYEVNICPPPSDPSRSILRERTCVECGCLEPYHPGSPGFKKESA